MISQHIANLSRWSTKGKLTCPTCNLDTDYKWLKHGRRMCYMDHRRYLTPGHAWRYDVDTFDGKEEHRLPPGELTGKDILEQLMHVGETIFGKASGKNKGKKKQSSERLN